MKGRTGEGGGQGGGGGGEGVDRGDSRGADDAMGHHFVYELVSMLHFLDDQVFLWCSKRK